MTVVSKSAFTVPALAGLLLAATALTPSAGFAACTTTVGAVMSLTGPAGPYGQAAAKSVELAFGDINKAGGVNGCDLKADIRDDQSQGSVGVDAAKQLVDVGHVPAILGSIISSVSMPILTTVTAPSKVVQISPASSSPSFTVLAAEGKTGGYWFRAITSDALQGVVAGKYALDVGLKKLSIIYVNSDFGVNMVKEFTKAYKALGGTIVSSTPYNAGQTSYQPEVTKGMEGAPDGLYLVSDPGDGAAIARAWISGGGPGKFLLNDGMNSAKFIEDVGAKYLDNAYGTSSGTDKSPSTDYFAKAYPAMSGGFDAGAPAADRSYDAAAILGLAIAAAGKAEATPIRDAIRKVLDPKGEPIYAGADQFKKGLDLIKAGKPIQYVGVIGAVTFDPNGDITGPFRLWRIQKGEVTTTGQMETKEVDALKAKIGG
jgi:branched-chain amino acid transport system substrate-binding protein